MVRDRLGLLTSAPPPALLLLSDGIWVGRRALGIELGALEVVDHRRRDLLPLRRIDAERLGGRLEHLGIHAVVLQYLKKNRW